MSLDRAIQDLVDLRQRADRLRTELMSIEERAHKIATYIEMASFYDGEEETRPVQVADAPTSIRSHGVADQLVAAVVAHLHEVSRRVRTVDLLEVLKAKGLQIPGANPANNLSSILSRTGELSSDRARGWGLKEWETDAQRLAQTEADEAISPPNASPQPSEQSPPASPVAW